MKFVNISTSLKDFFKVIGISRVPLKVSTPQVTHLLHVFSALLINFIDSENGTWVSCAYIPHIVCDKGRALCYLRKKFMISSHTTLTFILLQFL